MKEFIIRGQTASGLTHVINFGGHKGDYGFRLVEFQLYPSTQIGSTSVQSSATITAGKTAITPTDPDYDNEGLIGSALMLHASALDGNISESVVNDTFIITQDVILMVHDVQSNPINWQVKFMPVKLSTTEAALTNYRQFSIFDD
jgi:hypothetical protein